MGKIYVVTQTTFDCKHIVGVGWGIRKLFIASVKRQICLGLHFLLSVSLTAHRFQMRSVWAGQPSRPVCLTAGLRM